MLLHKLSIFSELPCYVMSPFIYLCKATESLYEVTYASVCYSYICGATFYRPGFDVCWSAIIRSEALQEFVKQLRRLYPLSKHGLCANDRVCKLQLRCVGDFEKLLSLIRVAVNWDWAAVQITAASCMVIEAYLSSYCGCNCWQVFFIHLLLWKGREPYYYSKDCAFPYTLWVTLTFCI